VREQAPVAGRLGAGEKHRGLPVELVDRAVHERLAEHLGGVVDQVPDREVVGAVHDHVVAAQDVERVLRGEQRVVGDHVNPRVEIVEAVGRGVHLLAAHVVRVVQDLALQVGQVDAVEVHDAERPDPGRGQVRGGRRAEATGPDAQHLRVEQLALPLPADPGQDDVPRVPEDLLLGEHRLGHRTTTSRSDTSPSTIRNARTSGWERSFSETST
jgi:hypothetical protein